MQKVYLQDKLIDILNNSEAFSLEINKDDFNPEISLLKDLKLDSIQLLDYLLAIELKLNIELDYQDLDVAIFESFNEFTNYFYEKVTKKSST